LKTQWKIGLHIDHLYWCWMFEDILHFSKKFEKSLKAFKFSKERANKHFFTVQWNISSYFLFYSHACDWEKKWNQDYSNCDYLLYQSTRQQNLGCSYCSAGVGRSGTFIALDTLAKQAKDRGEVNPFEVVRAMRRRRPCMVQTKVRWVVFPWTHLWVMLPLYGIFKPYNAKLIANERTSYHKHSGKLF